MKTEKTTIEISYTEAKKNAFLELAKNIKNLGFDTYISQSHGFNYGFFTTNEGKKCIYFQTSYFGWFDFSSSHNSKGLGTGHRLSSDGQYGIFNINEWLNVELLNRFLKCMPFYSRRKNEVFISWKTREDILKNSTHSNYIKL